MMIENECLMINNSALYIRIPGFSFGSGSMDPRESMLMAQVILFLLPRSEYKLFYQPQVPTLAWSLHSLTIASIWGGSLWMTVVSLPVFA